MILICEVHCSAMNKAYDDESDWYGILNIDPTTDEASIKSIVVWFSYFTLTETVILVQLMPCSFR